MDDIDPSGIKKMHLIMTIKITYGLWVEILTIFKIIIDLYGFRIYIYSPTLFRNPGPRDHEFSQFM